MYTMHAIVTTIRLWVKSHVRSELGQDLIEYAMLGGLIAIAIAASVLFLQGAIASMATGISNCIDFTDTTTCAPF